MSGQAGGEREAPKTFAEAKQRGDDLFGSIRSKMFVVDKGKEDLANSNLSAAEVKGLRLAFVRKPRLRRRGAVTGQAHGIRRPGAPAGS